MPELSNGVPVLRSSRLKSLPSGSSSPIRHRSRTPAFEPGFGPPPRHTSRTEWSSRRCTLRIAWSASCPRDRSSRMGRVWVPAGTRTGWLPTFFGEPPIAAGYGRPVAQAVVDGFARSGRSWLRLQTLDASSEFAAGVQAAAGGRGYVVHRETWSRGYATRRPEPSYVDAASHTNLGRLRRQWRSFERSTGDELAIRDLREDDGAIDRFLELEARGWKGREGVAFEFKARRRRFPPVDDELVSRTQPPPRVESRSGGPRPRDEDQPRPSRHDLLLRHRVRRGVRSRLTRPSARGRELRAVPCGAVRRSSWTRARARPTSLPTASTRRRRDLVSLDIGGAWPAAASCVRCHSHGHPSSPCGENARPRDPEAP